MGRLESPRVSVFGRARPDWVAPPKSPRTRDDSHLPASSLPIFAFFYILVGFESIDRFSVSHTMSPTLSQKYLSTRGAESGVRLRPEK
jgi:hypothetical protein